MAYRASTISRLSVGVVTCVLCLTVGVATVYAVPQRTRPQTHFLSWESARVSAKYKYGTAVQRPAHEYEVSSHKVTRLKRPSFFDKRPAQFSTPVVVDHTLYIGSSAGYFYSVDVAKDRTLWMKKTSGGIESPAAVDETAAYVGDIKGTMYAFNRTNGEIVWRTHLGGEMLGQPLVVGPRLYVATIDGRLFALERSSGTELWHTDTMERQTGFTVRRQSSPIYYNGMIIFGTSQGTLVAYREDGARVWTRLLGNPQAQVMDVDSRPVLMNDRLYASSADGMLFCIDPKSGAPVWSVPAGGANDVLYDEGKIFASGSGTLSRIDPDSGEIAWEQNFETAEISSPVAGNGYLAVVSTNEKIYLVDKDTGDMLYERYIRRGSYGDPIVEGDTIYVLSNSSRLFSFQVKEKETKEKKVNKKQRS